MYYHDRCKLDFMLFLLNCLMIINMIKLQYYQYPVQFSFSKQEQTSNTILSIMRYSYNLLYTVMSKAANTCNHDGIKIALLSREGGQYVIYWPQMQSLFIKLKKFKSYLPESPTRQKRPHFFDLPALCIHSGIDSCPGIQTFCMTNTLAIISHQNLTGIKYKLECLKNDDCCR